MDPGSSDVVDQITQEWRTVRPDVDVGPIEVVGRISRLSRLVDRRLAENFARFGLESWMYDMLATLRRQGEPYELSAGELVRHTMVTTGAVTNRVDRLVARGLAERATSTDRRKVIVRLTEEGRELVDAVVLSHLEVERQVLQSLTDDEVDALSATLRTLLLDLGDRAPGA